MRSSSRWIEARRIALALAALCVASATSAAPPVPRKLPPLEQCGGDPAFTAFRQKLTRAVLAKDRAGLLRLIAADATADFGGGQGPAAVGKMIDDAGDEYWMELQQVIKLGCARSGAARVIPSLVVQTDAWAEAADSDYLMVVLPGSRLRRTPEHDSPAIATLAWDVVKIIPGGDFQTQVVLRDGRKGWLMDSELAGPMGQRFYIEKRGGKWMVTALVAGD
jgi:hypothetical protein